tara:strand:- start:31559 stop:37381 length:5823 start_codon:yes stop_codon:yes gene_type:complete
MPEIDPYTTKFTSFTNPITADEQGLTILEKLKHGESILAGAEVGSYPEVSSSQLLLRGQLQKYREYKANRREPLFNYEPEVQARRTALNSEDLARFNVKLFGTGDESFDSVVEENGDTVLYQRGQAFAEDKSILRNAYSEHQMFRKAGFSDRQIEAGVADAELRVRFNAKDDGTETTLAAAKRWSLNKINNLDRRRAVQESAHKAANKTIMGQVGGVEEFSKVLDDDYGLPNGLTDEERTETYRIFNLRRDAMSKSMGSIPSILRRTFNTVAGEEGITTQFTEEGDAAYTSVEEAARAFGKIPRKDFPKAVAMMVAIAEEHGENKDGFMRKLGKNIARPADALFRQGARPKNIDDARDDFAKIRAMKGTGRGGGKDEFYAVEVTTEGSDVPQYDFVRKVTGTQSFFDTVFLGKTLTRSPESIEGTRKLPGQPTRTVRVMDSYEELTTATKGFENQLRGHEYASQLHNWRETVAGIEHDGDNDFVNMVVDDFVYGIAGSIPEMAAAATGIPGIMLVASAQSERNMMEIRNRTKPEDWENQEFAAKSAGMVYSLLNFAQLKTVTKGMPGAQSYIKKATGIWAMETAQELAQDFSLAATMELYGAVNDDIKDFDMFPGVDTNVDWFKDGTFIPQTRWEEGEGELVKLIKSAPRMAFAMLPFGVAGGLGSKALDHIEAKNYEAIFQNEKLLDMYGVSKERQEELKPLSLIDKLEFVKEHHAEFYKNIEELVLPQDTGEVSFHASAEGDFTVTNGEQSVTAKSPEEAAAAAEAIGTGLTDAEVSAAPIIDEGQGALGVLSEVELQTQWEKVDTELDKLEEGFDSYEGEGDYPQLGEMKAKQVEWENVKLERAKREAEGQFKEDLFNDYQSLVGDLGSPTAKKANEYSGRLARVQFQVLQDAFQSGEVTLESASKEMEQIYKPSNDRLEVLKGNQKLMVEWKDYFNDNAEVSPALPAPQTVEKAQPTAEEIADIEKIMELSGFSKAEIEESIQGMSAETAPAPVESKIDATDRKAVEDDGPAYHMSFLPGFNAPANNIDFDNDARQRRKAGLPPLTEGRDKEQQASAARRYELRRTWAGRDIGTKALDAISKQSKVELKAIESLFNDHAALVQKSIEKASKPGPKVLREARESKLHEDSFLALHGDVDAMKRLPESVQKHILTGRENIDFVSKELIKSGLLKDEVKKAVGKNIGKYITREFKVHQPGSKWDHKMVTEKYPDIYAKGIDYIVSKSKITRDEARRVVKKWLDPSNSSASDFIAGTGKVGKVDVTSFMKKGDLAMEILNLLGEVRTPMENIRNTGVKGAKQLRTYKMQGQMADVLIKMGLASRDFDEDKRLFDDNFIGREVIQKPINDPKTGEPTNVNVERVSSKYAGFGKLYVQPEILKELKGYFETSGKEGNWYDVILKGMATAVSIGKFNQVVLSPQAYGTNLLSGLVFEVAAGRVSWNNDGAKAYAKILSKGLRKKDNPYTFKEQVEVHGQTIEEFGDSSDMRTEQLQGELRRANLLDNSVFAGDLNDSVEAGLLGAGAKKLVKGASAGYQASDNAAKASAFIHEVNKWKRVHKGAINPKTKELFTMREVFDLAARDTRMTTQNYDMVHTVPKWLSQHGIVAGSYISFTSELIRNTANNVQLTKEELFSGNPELMKHGVKRLVGQIAVAGALYGLNEVASSVMSDMDDDEREAARSALPPWNEFSEMVWTGPDKNGNHGFFDASYLIPHQYFYNAFAMSSRPGTLGEKAHRSIRAITQPFEDLNILNQMAIDLWHGEDEKGKPVYDEVDGFDVKSMKSGKHVWENMFKPGLWRSFDKWNKSRTGEVGYAGSVSSPNDSLSAMLGVRTRRIDPSSEKFVVGNLSSFAYDTAKSKKGASKKKLEAMGEKERADKLEDIGIAQTKIEKDLIGTIKMLKTFGVDNDRIETGAVAARVPPALREMIPTIIAEYDEERSKK